MLKIKIFTFNDFGENTFVLYDESSEGIIVDPGCYSKSEQETLSDFIAGNNLHIKYLINTHCHIDHVLGNAFVQEKYKVPLLIHEKDIPTLKANEVIAQMYGFMQYQPSIQDQLIAEGDIIEFGSSKLDVVFVPGHAPGHIALYSKDQNFCIAGDVLFRGSIGRTDLPGGDFNTLIHSIHEKLFPLGDEVKIYPGHGPATDVGFEKSSNPFCALRA